MLGLLNLTELSFQVFVFIVELSDQHIVVAHFCLVFLQDFFELGPFAFEFNQLNLECLFNGLLVLDITVEVLIFFLQRVDLFVFHSTHLFQAPHFVAQFFYPHPTFFFILVEPNICITIDVQFSFQVLVMVPEFLDLS